MDNASPSSNSGVENFAESQSELSGETFESLAGKYNFHTIQTFAQTLTDLIVSEAKLRNEHGGECRVLDIGCGSGIGRELRHQLRVKQASTDYWGIEPDQEIEAIDGLFDHFQHALMETAELPDNAFDVAYSCMVMEHVADPLSFLTTLHRRLKPNGVYLFATPNANSFVPWATKILHSLHIDELAVRLVRGQPKVDEYHYPVQFRCNTGRELNKYAEAIGFAPPEYVYVEGSGAQSYLRGPLGPLGSLIAWKRKVWRRPESLATLICRMTKR